MMRSNPVILPVILIVTPRAENYGLLRASVTQGGLDCETRRADDALTALARIAGGGVRLVLADVSGPQQDSAARLASVAKIRAAAPDLPVIAWSDSSDAGEPVLARQAGASGWLTAGSSPDEVAALLAALLDAEQTGAGTPGAASSSTGTVVSVMGVKGGVGTTTVAMNLAASLTRRGSVILAELRPIFGSLQTYFQPGRMVRGFPNRSGGAGEVGDLVRSLWPAPGVAGLRVLFGPQTPDDCRDTPSATAAGLVHTLAGAADFVVLDLPASFSEANKAALGASHHLALALEPTAACLKLGNLLLEGMRGWERFPSSLGLVVVRQSPDGTPLSLAEVEEEAGIPIDGMVPPSGELCLKSARARVPMVVCDPESLAADCFSAMAQRLPLASRRAAPGRAALTRLDRTLARHGRE